MQLSNICTVKLCPDLIFFSEAERLKYKTALNMSQQWSERHLALSVF